MTLMMLDNQTNCWRKAWCITTRQRSAGWRRLIGRRSGTLLTPRPLMEKKPKESKPICWFFHEIVTRLECQEYPVLLDRRNPSIILKSFAFRSFTKGQGSAGTSTNSDSRKPFTYSGEHIGSVARFAGR